MKSFVVLSALVGCGLAAPVAEADAQYFGAGLVGGVYSAGHAIAAPAVATIAHAAPVATYAHAAPVTTVAHAAPVATYAHAAPVAIATAPVVQHVGYKVDRHVQHIPQVSVQRHTSTHTTSHVINHAPVVGAALAHSAVVAAPAVAGVVAAPAVAGVVAV